MAEALHAKDPLAAHVRDELGISEHTEAKPLVAAGASALTFAVGAALPLATAALVPEAADHAVGHGAVADRSWRCSGRWARRPGGLRSGAAVLRVTFWGAVAMAVTALVGKLFGAVV